MEKGEEGSKEEMSDIQLLTVVVTLLAIFGAMISNRKSVEDMRDVLRAESKTQAAEGKTQIAELQTTLQATLIRVENKIDHVTETLATHSERIDRLARGGRE